MTAGANRVNREVRLDSSCLVTHSTDQCMHIEKQVQARASQCGLLEKSRNGWWVSHCIYFEDLM